MAVIQKLGDTTSREVKPNFEDAKGDTWLKMTYEMKQAGTEHLFPHKPRKGQVEECYWKQVDAKLASVGKTFVSGISFDENGKIIRS
jgi:hypothetical protein